jgi:CyaY protein
VNLSEAEYDARALPELHRLVDALDALDEDALEAELAADILTIEFSDGAKYVINSHRAARQIWMAAERLAWHFDWNPGSAEWVAAKTGDELWSVVERSLASRLGHQVALKRA